MVQIPLDKMVDYATQCGFKIIRSDFNSVVLKYKYTVIEISEGRYKGENRGFLISFPADENEIGVPMLNGDDFVDFVYNINEIKKNADSVEQEKADIKYQQEVAALLRGE